MYGERGVIKKQLRAQLRAQRRSVPDLEIREKSRAVAEWVIGSKEFDRAGTVALYRACFGEVDTDDIFNAAKSAGKSLLYPHTDKANTALRFGVVGSLDRMEPGEWGIPEPPRGTQWIPVERIDLLVMPGVAFDRLGGRLGMGGGYYDRVLAKFSEGVVRMGIAYDFQVVDSVPMDENDKRVDCLVTETGILRFPERG